MSDSDDTDILLLIPPNFFLTETSLNESLDYNLFESDLKEKYLSPSVQAKICDQVECHSSQMEPTSIHRDSFLTPKSKNVADQLRYRRYNEISPGFTTNLTPTSALKSYTAASSTPFSVGHVASSYSTPSCAARGDNSTVLKEIDQYLDKCRLSDTRSSLGRAKQSRVSFTPQKLFASDELPMERVPPIHSETKKSLSAANVAISSMHSPQDDVSKSIAANKMSDWNVGMDVLTKQDDHLINLASIWSDDNLVKRSNETAASEEEQLRKRQSDRTIQNLQRQLQLYQEKYSDAIKIDQTKNEALARLHETNSSLIANMTQLESQLSAMELKMHREQNALRTENSELKKKIQQLQDNNLHLERKTNALLTSTNEVREIHKKQLDDLEIRLSNSKQNENLLNEEVNQLKQKLSAQQNECDRETRRRIELEGRVATLSQTVAQLHEKEKNLSKELDSQRSDLKSFYQTQLEEVVSAKLKEYQEQLDSIEGTLRKESKHNERIIVERAMKQIELINQKNEQEFALLNEKHKEEIELYRIRLTNATKTVEQLEEDLSTYRTKRRDIAERLHSVIETQWQKTLEIISNTEPSKNCTAPKKTLNNFNNSDDANHPKVENEIFETPNISKFRKNKSSE